MMSHDELRQQIPAWAASRLDAESSRLLDDHLAACESCRELAATARELAVAVREGGEALFEPHPKELALRDHAAGTSTREDRARIERHLRSCATCRLEVEGWRRVNAAKPSRAAAPRSRWMAPALAAAAGVLAGVALMALLQPAAERAWRGDSPLYVLPGMTRGEVEAPASAWPVPERESRVSVAIPLVLPDGTRDEARFRLDLSSGGGSPTWSIEMSAGEMRRHLATPAGVLHVTLPASALMPGDHELRISPAAPEGAPPIYRARIEIR